jgi:hypothetical protein
LSEKPSKMMKQYVIGWFGDKETYVQCHHQQNIFKNMNDWAIED